MSNCRSFHVELFLSIVLIDRLHPCFSQSDQGPHYYYTSKYSRALSINLFLVVVVPLPLDL